MKLPIKKKYFDKIKSGEKTIEYRDAHITFVCEETKETLTKQVMSVDIVPSHSLPKEYTDVIGDAWVISFTLAL